MNVVNAGAGPALNVRARVWWPPAEANTSPSATSQSAHLAVGTTTELGIEWPEQAWRFDARGYLKYLDLSGKEWQTHFLFQSPTTAIVTYVGSSDKLGQPQYSVGAWFNAPPDFHEWAFTPY